MANLNADIIFRNGNFADYTEANIKAGEPAVATDTKQVFVGVGTGEHVELLTEYDLEPVYTYTHTGNTEIVVTAVNEATGEFTSTAHGLSNGNILFPILNIDAGKVFFLNLVPTGLVINDGSSNIWYVVEKTDNTFKLSKSAGGAAVTYTVNASMDLTKWHFERSTVNAGKVITGLPASKRYRLELKTRCLQKNAGFYIFPNVISLTNDWLVSSGTAYAYPNISANGDIFNRATVYYDYTGMLNFKSSGYKIISNSTTTITATDITKVAVNPTLTIATDITGFNLVYTNLANGSQIDFFKN